jgi:hypothetical protein
LTLQLLEVVRHFRLLGKRLVLNTHIRSTYHKVVTSSRFRM